MHRMISRLSGLVMAAFTLGWLAIGVTEAVQKPLKEQTTYPSFIAPPATLNETVLSTDLVLLGRVVGSIQRDRPHPGNHGVWIRTGHRVKVLEVFRGPSGHDLSDQEITVVQSGGDRDRGGHIERLSAHGFPQLATGKEYVLFLTNSGEDWGPAYGPDAVFERSGDRVLPFGKSQTSTRQATQSWTEFLTVLRNSGIQRGGN
ncbi:hypothetical protein BH18ACI5_BH18ACI5_15250 [soil metagenome]